VSRTPSDQLTGTVLQVLVLLTMAAVSCSLSVLDVVSGLLAEGDLDERAMDAIKEFPAERALDVLAEFKQSNLEHVANKSAFLCSIMKVNRQKIKGGTSGSEQPVTAQRRPGPDEVKIKVSAQYGTVCKT